MKKSLDKSPTHITGSQKMTPTSIPQLETPAQKNSEAQSSLREVDTHDQPIDDISGSMTPAQTIK